MPLARSCSWTMRRRSSPAPIAERVARVERQEALGDGAAVADADADADALASGLAPEALGLALTLGLPLGLSVGVGGGVGRGRNTPPVPRKIALSRITMYTATAAITNTRDTFSRTWTATSEGDGARAACLAGVRRRAAD